MTPEHQAAETALRVALAKIEREARLFSWFCLCACMVGGAVGAFLGRLMS